MKEEVAKGWWDPHIFEQFEQLMKSGTAESLSRGVGAGQSAAIQLGITRYAGFRRR